MASQEMSLREVCLADHYEAAIAANDKRISELEAALREVIAWEGPIDLVAPELGGCLKAMWRARAVLEKKLNT